MSATTNFNGTTGVSSTSGEADVFRVEDFEQPQCTLPDPPPSPSAGQSTYGKNGTGLDQITGGNARREPPLGLPKPPSFRPLSEPRDRDRETPSRERSEGSERSRRLRETPSAPRRDTAQQAISEAMRLVDRYVDRSGQLKTPLNSLAAHEVYRELRAIYSRLADSGANETDLAAVMSEIDRFREAIEDLLQ